MSLVVGIDRREEVEERVVEDGKELFRLGRVCVGGRNFILLSRLSKSNRWKGGTVVIVGLQRL